MKKIIIEVGSTATKVDLYDGENLKRIKLKTIEFKSHYSNESKLNSNDVKDLIDLVNEAKEITDNIYVCGTSIFRKLEQKEKELFLTEFKKETGYDFHIISSSKENELTVLGVAREVKDQICVMIGGGGSTEIAVYNQKIIESVNTEIGVIDVLKKFPDLSEDIATTSLSEVEAYIKDNLNLPENKADILVLAGGAHKYFAETIGFNYGPNTIYDDLFAPIMMDIDTRIKDTENFFKNISLDEIKSRVDDPNWWSATRAMCAFALVLAKSIDAKYIIPTDISMAYGLLNEE